MSLFSCRDIARLISQSLDCGLALGQRLTVRVHLLLCPACSRFRRQMLFLHRAAGEFEERDGNNAAEAPILSPEARARIQGAIDEEGSGAQG